MYTVTVGEQKVRVADKTDAMILVNILFSLDCDERISSKPLTMKEQETEEVKECEKKS